MAPTKKSIYRQPGAQHFQLVHRSVRDPLINDPEASKQVFKPVGRANDKSGGAVTLDELEAEISPATVRANEGEATGYGITYDDSSYDYMQHLKPVGEGGFDSVLLAAPGRGSAVAPGMKNQGQRSKGKMRGDDLFEMPEDVLASRKEVSVADVHAQQQAIPPELQGFQPDMNPHLRQVLEALEDDAFVEDDDVDVFGELLGSGETDDPEVLEDFEFAEWGVPEDGEEYEDDDDARTEDGKGEETWEDRFRAFKAAGGKPAAPVSNGGWESDGDAERSEMADTVGSLVSGMGDMMVRGGKKRKGKRGPSDASGMSMSSASVYRNNNLRQLDDAFDRIEREYEIDDSDEEEWLDEDDDGMSMAPSNMSTMSRVSFLRGDEPTGAGPTPEISRDDFDSIMDDFLDNYEVVGNRMRESLGATNLTGPEKLRVLRSALEDGEQGPSQEENRKRIFELERRIEEGTYKEEQDALERTQVEQPKDQWDVETILSTYTNTENIPGTIRVRSSAEAKERAQRRAEAAAAAAAIAEREDENDESDDSGSETEREAPKVTVARAKGESAEERKARKAAVKAERASRRAEKKQHKQTFGDERKRQLASQKKMVANGRAADMAVGSRGGVVSLS